MMPAPAHQADEDAGWVDLHVPGRPQRLEYRWLSPQRRDAPLLVFLHEGLGSVSMWKDWPQQVCEAAGCRGLVYSRHGYGRSTPLAAGERRAADFMHREAEEVLPALLAALGVDAGRDRPVLFGHSDGGSIALLYAARHPAAVAGVVAAAPHIFVETRTVDHIRLARQAYQEGGLRERLARHHDDVDSAFRGWNDIWLDPGFAQWDLRTRLPAITCPVLAMQGIDDEYGTLAQIRGIRDAAPQTQLLEIPDCRHSPHKDQPATVIQAIAGFIGALDPPGRR